MIEIIDNVVVFSATMFLVGGAIGNKIYGIKKEKDKEIKELTRKLEKEERYKDGYIKELKGYCKTTGMLRSEIYKLKYENEDLRNLEFEGKLISDIIEENKKLTFLNKVRTNSLNEQMQKCERELLTSKGSEYTRNLIELEAFKRLETSINRQEKVYRYKGAVNDFKENS